MTAPDLIYVGIRGVNTHKADKNDVAYVRRDHAALAADETVQAMICAGEGERHEAPLLD